MSIAIKTDDRISGSGTYRDSTNALQQMASFGSGILPSVRQQYSYGTGDNQVNKWYLARRTLAATTYDNLNLTSGLATMGVTQAFTALKRVLIAIIDPDGTKALQVGPQNQTHANQLWFAGVTANFYETLYTSILKDRPITGWSVSSGSTDVLSIYNPTANPITYAIWLLGTG
jgi:hypothetical protein